MTSRKMAHETPEEDPPDDDEVSAGLTALYQAISITGAVFGAVAIGVAVRLHAYFVGYVGMLLCLLSAFLFGRNSFGKE